MVVNLIETRLIVTTELPREAQAGNKVQFSGYLEDVNGNKLSGKSVKLVRDGMWIDGVCTGARGEWSFSILLTPRKKPYSLYAEFPGGINLLNCVNPPPSVKDVLITPLKKTT